MRYFSYNEPIWAENDDRDACGHVKIRGNRVITKSEDEIRAEYFPYWEARMIDRYGEETYRLAYSFEDCLDQWIVTNWAWQVED
jgi:hypothetical protein